MSTQFALDLRLARRKAGYTQEDVGHLLSGRQSLVSELELGRRSPSLEHIIELSLIYGRSFESFFAALMEERQIRLRKRLKRLPQPSKETAHTFNRANSLRRLKRRLMSEFEHGSA